MAFLRIPRPWEKVTGSEVTPESVYRNRREILRDFGIAGIGSLGALTAFTRGSAQGPGPGPYGQVSEFWSEKWSDLFPAKRTERFQVEGEITDQRTVTGYNNFYEFSLQKEKVRDLVDEFEVHPWQVGVKGEVEKEGTFDLDDLIRMGELEERVYHLRCVEAWSANVPWTGFPLSQLIRKLKPTADAHYVRFYTVLRPSEMPTQRNGGYGYPWPYYEALRMDEAMNELALLTFGVYGHPLNKQNGAPVRLILPWKFGFKSIKSIVRIEFVKRQPGTFWNDISREYGFYGNVNPKFDHPRWSQASELFLSTRERIPTRLYNGYGEFVGGLYDETERKYFY
jgi:sulfoxide reductase catalytic subunit YedY